MRCLNGFQYDKGLPTTALFSQDGQAVGRARASSTRKNEMKRGFATVAIAVLLVYVVLVFGAAGCLFVQLHGLHHAHESGSHAAHSMLCAWLCQVNPTVSLHAAAPLLAGVILTAIQRLIRVIPQSSLIVTVSRSRAPPSLSLFEI
jgi:hypothetical protein